MKLYAIALKDTCLSPDPPVLYTETVYLVNTDETTHCCELTPSYYLEPLYINVVCAEGTSDEDREKAYDIWGDLSSCDGTYMHCRYIDRIIEEADPCKVRAADHSKDDPDETPEEIWESWRESWQGNCPL